MRLHQPVPIERQPHLHQGGIPADGRYDPNSAGNAGVYADGGSINPLTNILGNISSKVQDTAKDAQKSVEQSKDKPNPAAKYDDGGMVAETGTVDPNSYLRWPNQVDTAGSGFEDGGQVDPNAFLDPMDSGNNMQALAQHASQVYQDYHRQLEQQWSSANQAQAPQTDFGDTDTTPDQNFAAGGEVAPNNEGTGDEGPPQPPPAMGGGLPPGPGPAGAGVTPKPAKSPQQAIDRNFYQDQSSRQFTSPSVGTSFTQPGPLGGQRGQEWYGKGRGNGRR